MADNTMTDWSAWRGHDVVDTEGTKIGKVEDIYLDDDSGQPEWLAVKTGMFGNKHSFVPLEGSTSEGENIRIGYTKAIVSDAPRVEAEQHMSAEEEAELYRYYKREYTTGAQTTPGTAVRTATETTTQAPVAQQAAAPASTGGSDDAMTRSEEVLRAGTVQREAGKARLRKYVETEHVTQTVPVRTETVTVEREPITDANRDKATSGPEIKEAVHEVTLQREEAVAQTEVVAQERVRLAKETTTEQQTVEADVCKERIVTEGVDDSGKVVPGAGQPPA